MKINKSKIIFALAAGVFFGGTLVTEGMQRKTNNVQSTEHIKFNNVNCVPTSSYDFLKRVYDAMKDKKDYNDGMGAAFTRAQEYCDDSIKFSKMAKNVPSQKVIDIVTKLFAHHGTPLTTLSDVEKHENILTVVDKANKADKEKIDKLTQLNKDMESKVKQLEVAVKDEQVKGKGYLDGFASELQKIDPAIKMTMGQQGPEYTLNNSKGIKDIMADIYAKQSSGADLTFHFNAYDNLCIAIARCKAQKDPSSKLADYILSIYSHAMTANFTAQLKFHTIGGDALYVVLPRVINSDNTLKLKDGDGNEYEVFNDFAKFSTFIENIAVEFTSNSKDDKSAKGFAYLVMLDFGGTNPNGDGKEAFETAYKFYMQQ